MTVECDGAGNVSELNNWLANNGNAVVVDNCGSVTWSNDYSGISYLCGNAGTVAVTFTATDQFGNTLTTSAAFTIEDTQAPVIEQLAIDSAETDRGFCTSLRPQILPNVSDTCDNSVIPVTSTDFIILFL